MQRDVTQLSEGELRSLVSLFAQHLDHIYVARNTLMTNLENVKPEIGPNAIVALTDFFSRTASLLQQHEKQQEQFFGPPTHLN